LLISRAKKLSSEVVLKCGLCKSIDASPEVSSINVNERKFFKAY